MQKVIEDFLSETNTPSYIIDSLRDDVDPQDGAVAGPSGLCRVRTQNSGCSRSNKNPGEQSDCQVPAQPTYGNEEESTVSNVSTSVFHSRKLQYPSEVKQMISL